ncbi:conserved unknown protein [Ectocarpus siliculosus]|uniref:Uncharacterized protein n=1 Tax=Ectocarpus siliculosus TaxID=2880 RepID=D7G1U8_ECTSI|nr:conserved unknown protein [Ectocarpus siliculosus]|eukprot:CBJ48674.1 conserved unknown protein [Ectocarpus siliculosus]
MVDTNGATAGNRRPNAGSGGNGGASQAKPRHAAVAKPISNSKLVKPLCHSWPALHLLHIQVAPKGQVAALGVREGWRLTNIGKNDFTVTATSTPKHILEALAAARKRGTTYTLGFSTGGADEAPNGAVRAEEQSIVEACDGSRVDNAVSETAGGEAATAGPASGGETGNSDQVCVEGKELEQDRKKGASAGVEIGENGETKETEGKGEGQVFGGKDVPSCKAETGRGDGEVTLMYEMYDEKFPIKDGSISAAEIDETYCLSFVMPNCTLHLGPLGPADRYARENEGELVPYLEENPSGTFHGLEDGEVYWVYVSRDDEEEKQDRERMKQVVQGMKQDLPEDGEFVNRKDDGRNGLESCSCVYGNPCVDEYGCKDWHSRYAVAKANGWKGF